MSPRTPVGRRRLSILKAMAASKLGLTVPGLSERLGFCTRTVRDHLLRLEALGMVTRLNYRRWQVASGVNLARLDGTRLDPGGSHDAHR
jgi:DNA-binding IclR family transcriptional regulator